MHVRRAAVLGGGPGGLYAARLLKLAQPSCEVVVHEQGEPGTTFGFGVGLAAGTQRKLEAADADTLHDILGAGCRHDMTMAVSGRQVRVRNDRLIGIARTELLAILQRHAEKAGVRIEYGARRTAAELDADLVIAADGISSATRGAGEFGESVDVGRGLFLWCGADFALPDALFAPVETEHGVFVTHAYPYAGGRSTFLIETDEETWQRAGFDRSTEATPPDASDAVSLNWLQDVFAEQLRGSSLIGNRTRWTRFRTVRCDRWSDGRTVLLGDAAHTAHFSIGSGTKLAMEDAIGLVEALREEPDAEAAFSRYETVRRPAVERLQELARRSRLWWESFPSRLDIPVEQLMVAYMTRAGNVPLDRFADSSPDVVAAASAHYASAPPPTADPVGWVLQQPLRHRGTEFSRRVVATVPDELAITVFDAAVADPWNEAGDAVVAQARRSGADVFRFRGPAARPDVLTRLDLAERVRTEVGGLVIVDGPESLRADLAAGLLSGRCDLVSFTG
ncbi:FAD-dependent monooxygenase [Amycolatopsis benzoatilytica]|uniref:FAD-dependent monooxygenase n=1 Tax=Amycolatopsis benzoatilytica TaxID=346045 RepID=UPI00036CFE9C|nr:FAD-dependent monooxygenase [Amycolatopsis benzoatilytica]